MYIFLIVKSPSRKFNFICVRIDHGGEFGISENFNYLHFKKGNGNCSNQQQ